jgi:sulfonate transport system substrate-binding protein
MTSYFNIGGVPEHFNIPFRKAIDEGVFSTRNIELIWKDYRGGTGDLIKAIKEKQIDIGVVLTEGAVKAIADGAPMKIVQVYVNSPLYWGIYCGNQSPFTRLNEVENPSFCISRFGSGSHLMAYLLCQQQGWTMDKVEFVEVGSFSGALKEFNHNPDRLFLWERFMTKPYLDSGTLKKIGEIPTPWASFSIVAHHDILIENEDRLIEILKTISDYTYKFKQNTLDSIDYVSNYFEFSVSDMKNWIQDTDWNYLLDVPYPKLKIALDFLKEVQLVDKNFDIHSLCPDDNFWEKCSL